MFSTKALIIECVFKLRAYDIQLNSKSIIIIYYPFIWTDNWNKCLEERLKLIYRK
jgi:hypothetical protein